MKKDKVRDSLSESAEEREKKDMKLMPHSKHYHRYFEDYSERLVADENGKRHIERKYVGKYYSRNCSELGWLLIKAGYSLLIMTAAVLFSWGSMQDVPANKLQIVAMCNAVSTLSGFALVVVAVICLTKKQKMDVHDYRSGFKRLKLFCLVTSVCMAVNGGAILLAAATETVERSENSFAAGLTILLAAVLLFVVFCLEKQAHYTVEAAANDTTLDDFVIQP